jgi:hypothetical protein
LRRRFNEKIKKIFSFHHPIVSEGHISFAQFEVIPTQSSIKRSFAMLLWIGGVMRL